jgi:hypothetical protein
VNKIMNFRVPQEADNLFNTQAFPNKTLFMRLGTTFHCIRPYGMGLGRFNTHHI